MGPLRVAFPGDLTSNYIKVDKVTVIAATGAGRVLVALENAHHSRRHLFHNGLRSVVYHGATFFGKKDIFDDR